MHGNHRDRWANGVSHGLATLGGDLWRKDRLRGWDHSGPAIRNKHAGPLTDANRVRRAIGNVSVANRLVAMKHPVERLFLVPGQVAPQALHVPQAFDPGELRVLNLLADQAALAIENARLHNLTMHQALTDSLTDLANRRAFDHRLEEEIRRSNRYQHSFALMMIDIDGFKQINDTFGHPVGDKVLQILSQRMLKVSRDTDFLFCSLVRL